jgi:hypothetical protein
MNRELMAIVLALSAVDRGFEPSSDQAKDFKIGICCFSTKHAVLRCNSMSIAQNRDNVRVERHVYSRTVALVSQHNTNLTKHVGLVQCAHHYHLMECNLFSPLCSTPNKLAKFNTLIIKLRFSSLRHR